MNARRTVIAVVACACVGAVCAYLLRPREEPEIIRNNSAGDRYEATGELFLHDNDLTFRPRKGVPPEKYEQLPVGTELELVIIEEVNASSWNTGSYTYYTAKMKILTGAHRGKTVGATGLITGQRFPTTSWTGKAAILPIANGIENGG